MKGEKKLATQLYIKDYPGNEKDGIFKKVAADPKKKKAIEVVVAKWDVVLGFTPES